MFVIDVVDMLTPKAPAAARASIPAPAAAASPPPPPVEPKVFPVIQVEATRERLASGEGIPAERLTVGERKADAAPAPATDGGRVEFTVVAGGD